ncbi:37S ribosomal protein S10, mitochondrial [Candida viswanathii]|uniref:37S ribosomal protein S10, mitochondrial n=1 Tax=Candida viswanathii TaxID=5486 RepID=A0A367YEY1_9ASCO|nr:37S ribosomal protein S10, mitochondrial [Candida viswanathii]
MIRVGIRGFSTRTRVFKISPAQYVEKVKQKKIEDAQFRESLVEGHPKYEPQLLSTHDKDGKPFPLNVELLKYKPLRLPKTHGHEVATLTMKGYDDDDLIRMGEFAMRAAYFLGIPMSGLTPLKTQKRLYTVIKSPFAQAKTKQNFHRVTYARKLIAYDANPDVIDLWLSYINRYKFADIEYSASLMSHEPLNYVDELAKLDEFKLPEAYNGIEDPVAKKVESLLKSDKFKKYLKE